MTPITVNDRPAIQKSMTGLDMYAYVCETQGCEFEGLWQWVKVS